MSKNNNAAAEEKVKILIVFDPGDHFGFLFTHGSRLTALKSKEGLPEILAVDVPAAELTNVYHIMMGFISSSREGRVSTG